MALPARLSRMLTTLRVVDGTPSLHSETGADAGIVAHR